MNPRSRAPALVVAVSLVLTACGADSNDSTNQGDAGATTATATATATDSATGADPDAAPDRPSEPAEQARAATPTVVRFTTPDGETLEAAMFGDGNIGIVLAHMRGRDKTTWYSFAQDAVASGYRVLAFDFRGYGGSTGEQDTDLDVDLIAAVEFLRSQGITNTVVMGASMGATASINVASRLDLSAAVSLSAPGNFLGLEATDVAVDIGEPLLVVAAENDQPYADSAVEIANRAPATQLQIFAGNGHGTNLFSEYETELTALLLDFVRERVG